MDNIDIQEHDRLISRKLLDLVYQRYLISFMSSMLVSVALTAMLWPMVEKRTLLIWLLLLWSVMAVRSFYSRRYLRQEEVRDYGRWRAGMVAGSAAAGASWGLSVYFIPSSPFDTATLPLIFVITGVTAFASVALAAEWRAVAAFILATLLPLIYWLFSYADRLHAYLGVISLVYMGLMLLFSRRMYDLVRSSISNAERNHALKAALEQVKVLEYAAAQMQIDSSYAELFASFEDNIVFVDVAENGAFSVASINPAAENSFCLKNCEVRGKSKAELFPPELAARLESYDQACVASGKPVHYEEVLEHPTGSRFFSITHIPMRDETGRIYRIAAISRDITERKQTEAMLLKREEQFRTLAENSPDPIFRYDRECRSVYINNIVEQLAAVPMSMLLGKSPIEVMPTSGSAMVAQRNIQHVLNTGKRGEFELYFVAADGRELIFHNLLVPEFAPDGSVESVLAIGRDITARKHMEEVLLHSERAYRMLAENSPDNIIRYDRDLRIRYLNKNLEASLAIPATFILGKTPSVAFSDGMFDELEMIMKEVIGSGHGADYYMTLPDIGDGERYHHIRLAPEKDEMGEVAGILAIGRDITERKRIENALFDSEQMLQEAQRIAHVGSWKVDMLNDKLIWSDEIFRIWEIDKSVFRANFAAFLETVHPEDRESVTTAYNDAIRNHSIYEVEHRLLFPDGRIKYILERGEPQFDAQGKPVRFIGTSLDITERKHMEMLLKKRESEFRSLAENSPDLIGRFDRECRRLYANKAMASLAGKPSEALVGVPPTDGVILDSTHAERLMAGIREVFVSGKSVRIDLSAIYQDGCAHEFDALLVPEFGDEGDVEGVLLLSRDITERKHMEEALSIREREFRSLAENLPDNIARWDVQGCYLYLNPIHERTLGVSASEVIGKPIPDTHAKVKAAIAQVVATGLAVELVRQPVPVDGEMQIHQVSLSPEFDAEGRIVGVLGLGRDMTDFYRLQDDLASSEQQFRTLAENAPDPIFRYDLECRRIYVNPAVTRITGQSASLLGKTPEEVPLVSPAGNEQLLRDIRQVIQTGRAHDSEVEYTAPDGRYYYFSNRFGPELGSDGRVAGVVSIMRDISALKRAEAALKEKYARIVELNDYLEENARNLEEQAVELEAQAVELEASQEQIKLTEAWYRGIIHSAPDGMLVVDANGIIRLVNLQLSEMFGYEHGELNGYPIELLLPPDVREKHVSRRAAFFASDVQGRPMSGSLYGLRGCRRDGSEFPVDVSLARLPDMEGQVGAICATIRDITERRRVENALAEREKEFRTLVENTPDVIVRYDRDCRRIYVNPEWGRVNGIPMAEVLGKTPQEISVRVKPIAADFEQKLRDVMASGRIREMDLLWHDDVGNQVCFALSMIPEFDSNGEVSSVLTVARDISERRRMEDALAIKEQESRSLIDNSPDNISRYDHDCRRVYANPTYGAMVDGGVAALLGKKPSEFPGGANADLYEAKIKEVFSTGQLAEFELKWADSLGREVCSHIRLAPEYDKSGNVVSVLTVGRDITELNDHRKRIYQMAFYDTLTNLPNRALFNERLHQMLIDASLRDQLGGVMLLDLDRFKLVNDTLGHSAGDDLLREAALRLTYCVRGYDTVARLGGDEFAILLPEIRASDDLSRVAGKILESFNDPFILTGKEVFVSSSIGISVYPIDSLCADDLLKQADSAMYFAKRSGRNNFRFYSSGMTETANERMVLEGDLRRGFVRDELILHFQPKVRLEDGKVVGSEALLRWQHPELGMIPPDKFISIAEDSGLIVEIGEWVLRHACQVACEWNVNGRQHKLAINLSARQFQSNDLLKTVRNVLAETSCNPEWIELEITESLLLDEEGDVLEVLAEFRKMGISIAIDDFGTGYSALSYLARFPIDILKIDRSFTSRITESGHHAELVKAIISIAKCLNQQVVAEGAETAEEVALLKSYGCHLVQGYFYGKPVPKSAFEAHFN